MTTPDAPKHHEHEEALLLRDALIAGLAGAANDLAEVGRELYRASVLTKVQRVVLFIILAVNVGALVALLVVAGQNKSNGTAIRNCTTEGADHTCFNDGTKRQGLVIQQLVKQNEAAAWCSPRSKTPAEFTACIRLYVAG